MVPLLEKPEREWKKAAYTMITLGGLGRSVRTKQFRYAEYRKTREFPTNEEPFAKELYDLENDPYEQNNLADLAEYTEQQNELAKLLLDGWEGAAPKL